MQKKSREPTFTLRVAERSDLSAFYQSVTDFYVVERKRNIHIAL